MAKKFTNKVISFDEESLVILKRVKKSNLSTMSGFIRELLKSNYAKKMLKSIEEGEHDK